VCACERFCLHPESHVTGLPLVSFSLSLSLSIYVTLFLLSSLNFATGPLQSEAAKSAVRWTFIRRETWTICSTRYKQCILHRRCGQSHVSAVLAARLAIRTAAYEPEGHVDLRFGDRIPAAISGQSHLSLPYDTKLRSGLHWALKVQSVSFFRPPINLLAPEFSFKF
jgi:hypothetical protein